MNKFKKGDKVKISEIGMREYHESDNNPYDTVGSVVEIYDGYDYGDHYFIFRVRWPEGTNTYDEHELERVEEMEYEEGKWYPCTGDKCPVHPDTKVICMFYDGSGVEDVEPASVYSWDIENKPVAFKVVKHYKEPTKEMTFEEWLEESKNNFESATVENAIVVLLRKAYEAGKKRGFQDGWRQGWDDIKGL
jgi:hypothetical protein